MSKPQAPVWGKCPECGSEDLAHYAEWWGTDIPAGTHGFIGCRECGSWWDVEATAETEHIFTGDWRVVAMGQGTYGNVEERRRTILWERE